MDVSDAEPDPYEVAAPVADAFAKANDRPQHMRTEFLPAETPKEKVRHLTGRTARRRADKAACCELCGQPMTATDRMTFRMPDPRRENWGVNTNGLGHPRCIAKSALKRAEAAERALAELSQAVKTRKADAETATRQKAMGLWTPRQGAQ